MCGWALSAPSSFRNVTKGRVADLRNPDVRVLGFSPDGANVEFWTKTADAAGGMIDYYWTATIVGDSLRRSAGSISEVGWSANGERFVYHPSAPGEPLFITSRDISSAGDRIYGASPGVHNHFPLLSPDGESMRSIWSAESRIGSIPAAALTRLSLRAPTGDAWWRPSRIERRHFGA